MEEYRNIAWACRNADRKVKAELELKLGRNVKDTKKSFCTRRTVKEPAR